MKFPLTHPEDNRSNSDFVASLINSGKKLVEEKETIRKEAAKKSEINTKLIARIAIPSGHYRKIGFDAYEQTIGNDPGSIWYITTDASGENWLVKDVDETGEIIRHLISENIGEGITKEAHDLEDPSNFQVGDKVYPKYSQEELDSFRPSSINNNPNGNAYGSYQNPPEPTDVEAMKAMLEHQGFQNIQSPSYKKYILWLINNGYLDKKYVSSSLLENVVKKEAAGDTVSKIMAYENGELSDEETIQFFQELIDSGLAWRLQGSYGRMAQRLIEEGLCTTRNATAAVKNKVATELSTKISDDLPDINELMASKAKMVVDKINHREFVLNGTRYFVLWDSKASKSNNSVVGWVTYKSEPENKVSQAAVKKQAAPNDYTLPYTPAEADDAMKPMDWTTDSNEDEQLSEEEQDQKQGQGIDGQPQVPPMTGQMGDAQQNVEQQLGVDKDVDIKINPNELTAFIDFPNTPAKNDEQQPKIPEDMQDVKPMFNPNAPVAPNAPPKPPMPGAPAGPPKPPRKTKPSDQETPSPEVY
jgi:hypothetical protein